jgi:hypothetical protein
MLANASNITVCELLGVPYSNRHDFITWTDTML